MDGLDFYTYFKSGAEEVGRHREHLNSINVFPVRDGDTGTNLAITMHSMVEEVNVSKDFSEMIRSLSDVAFENARGNSGIIFASFIGGFSRGCGHLKTLTIADFSKGADVAVSEAYGAVSEPVEGTMLTVIKDWADYISKNHHKYHHFGDLFEGAFLKAKKTLEETPDMLEILKKSKVVDSGAKGFVMFLEGFNRLVSDIMHHNAADEKVVVLEDEAHRLEIPLYRYCTEVVAYTSITNKKAIESLIAPLGDSAIVTGNERLVKTHIHTNSPDLVTKAFIESGYKVSKSKVDDMLLQVEVETAPKSKIAILTDSIADIDQEQLLKEQIHTIALSLIADDSVYLDKLTATKNNISTILNHSKVYPTSSQPDVKQIKMKLEWLLSHYDHIVVITVAKALSGTYANFERAITELNLEANKVTLVDSKLNSGAQGLIVLEAARMANRGETLERIISKIISDVPKTSIYVSLDTFKYAVKSGRVPNTLGKFMMHLNAKPIMSLDNEGKGIAFGLAFSRKSIDKKIVKLVRRIKEKEGIYRYAIVHANNPELAARYQHVFETIIGQPPEIVTEISAITAIHAGIGAVAIAITREALL